MKRMQVLPLAWACTLLLNLGILGLQFWVRNSTAGLRAEIDAKLIEMRQLCASRETATPTALVLNRRPQ